MSASQSMTTASASSSVPLSTTSTQGLSVMSSTPLVSNDFSFRMLYIGMQCVSTSSNPIFQNPSFNIGSPSTPQQVFPWGRGHIPPSNPSLGSGNFRSSEPVFGANPLVGWGGQMIRGFQSFDIPASSNPFTLFGNFGSNTFPSSRVP
jgi:hypothetical protein